jgi:hypothetical protein
MPIFMSDNSIYNENVAEKYSLECQIGAKVG